MTLIDTSGPRLLGRSHPSCSCQRCARTRQAEMHVHHIQVRRVFYSTDAVQNPYKTALPSCLFCERSNSGQTREGKLKRLIQRQIPRSMDCEALARQQKQVRQLTKQRYPGLTIHRRGLVCLHRQPFAHETCDRRRSCRQHLQRKSSRQCIGMQNVFNNGWH